MCYINIEQGVHMNVKGKLVFSILGLLIGYFFIGYLTWTIQNEDIALVILLIVLFITINKFKLVKYKKECIKIILIATMISYLSNSLYLYHDGVEIQFPSKIESDFQINKKDAVIFVFPANPPVYQQDNWSQVIHNSNEYSDFKKSVFSSFILYKYKNIYKQIGKDPSEELSIAFFKELKEKNFENKKLYISFLNHKPILEEQIIEAMQQGAEKIYIVNMLLDQSDQWFEIQERIEKIRFYNYKTQFLYVDPFWKSTELIKSYTEEIQKAIHETNKENIGILFIGKGYKKNIAEEYTDSIYQQTVFAREIKDKLVIDGYDENNIMISYLNDERFSIKEVLPQLLEEGVTALVVVPIYIPFKNLESKVMIPEMVHKIDIPPSIEIKHITGWNLEKEFIEEIENSIASMEKKA